MEIDRWAQVWMGSIIIDKFPVFATLAGLRESQRMFIHLREFAGPMANHRKESVLNVREPLQLADFANRRIVVSLREAGA